MRLVGMTGHTREKRLFGKWNEVESGKRKKE